MTKDVTSLFETDRYGLTVAIPETTVKKAIKTNDVLHIVYKGTNPKYQGQIMTMDPESLTTKKLYTSKEVYENKYGGEDYRLDYFRWNPNDTYDD